MQHQRVVEMTYFQAHARIYTVMSVMPQLIERTEYNISAIAQKKEVQIISCVMLQYNIFFLCPNNYYRVLIATY